MGDVDVCNVKLREVTKITDIQPHSLFNKAVDRSTTDRSITQTDQIFNIEKVSEISQQYSGDKTRKQLLFHQNFVNRKQGTGISLSPYVCLISNEANHCGLNISPSACPHRLVPAVCRQIEFTPRRRCSNSLSPRAAERSTASVLFNILLFCAAQTRAQMAHAPFDRFKNWTIKGQCVHFVRSDSV